MFMVFVYITKQKRNRLNIRLMLVHRLRRWPNINLLDERLMFVGYDLSNKHNYNPCNQQLNNWHNDSQLKCENDLELNIRYNFF